MQATIDDTKQKELANQLIEIALKLQVPQAPTCRRPVQKKNAFRGRIEQLWLAKYKRIC